ncbi:serine hydrolase domain-containing protein [Streptomyces anandii]|uniref:serine hydrolase domain-containing protein n=1 Tax=Streptomyces anandii TaxID=285454 RepID=UPI003791EBDA
MREQLRQASRSSKRQRHARRTAASIAAVVALGVITAGALVYSPASAAAPDRVQQSLDALVRADGMPAALASVKDRDGRYRTYTAGVADLATHSPVPADGRVRIGSNTKAFTAVVVLQLVGENRIGLGATVDTYLPGLVRGNGINGRHITIRQLLQHTSGLPDYGDSLNVSAMQHRYIEPRDLLDIALRGKAHFPPGTKWEYSNTNYLLLGLIVQKITGRPVGEEIDRRVIKRIGLRDTYFPAQGDMSVEGPHPHGYFKDPATGALRDFTRMDPAWAWAAGALISTGSDLDRFYSALLAGRLMPAAQLAQMQTTVPAPPLGEGVRYGLGLVSRPLSCGGVYWGHGGDIPGYKTRGGATADGRAANVAVTGQARDKRAAAHVEEAVDTALCH